MKKWITAFFLLTLWVYALIQVYSLRSYRGQVFMYYGEGEEPEAERLMEAVSQEEEREPGTAPGITAWRLEEAVIVGNRELGKTGKADCISVYGLREPALGKKLESGVYGYLSDPEGCIISKGLAVELFGAVMVTGKEVVCRDKSYMIRGVTDDRESVILIPAQKNEGMRYLILNCAGDTSGRMKAERFLYSHGLKKGYVCVDGSLFWSAAGCIAMAALFGMAVLGGVSARRKPLKLILPFSFILAGVFLIWKLNLTFPSELIPDRWSDFGFWPERFRRLRLEMGRMNEAYRAEWLKQAKIQLLISAVSSVSSFIGLWCIPFKGNVKKFE